MSRASELLRFEPGPQSMTDSEGMACMFEGAEAIIRELEAKLTQERSDHLKAEDAALARIAELEAERDELRIQAAAKGDAGHIALYAEGLKREIREAKARVRELEERIERARDLVTGGLVRLDIPECVVNDGICCSDADPTQECHCENVADYPFCVCYQAVPCGNPECRGQQLADILGVGK